MVGSFSAWTCKAASERVQMTKIEGGIGGYKWSPDGKRLLLSIRDEVTDDDSIPGHGSSTISYSSKTMSATLITLPTHLYVHDLESRTTIQITDGDHDEYGAAWSPDGTMIAFTSNRTEDPDRNDNSDIWLVKSDLYPHDKQEPVQLTTNPGPDGSPIWHPDGKRIAYLNELHRPDRHTRVLPADKNRDHWYRQTTNPCCLPPGNSIAKPMA